MELSERMLVIRNHFNLNQTVFANSLGLEQGSYSGIETGRTKTLSKSVLKLLEVTYNINPEWLLGNDEKMLLKKEYSSVEQIKTVEENNPKMVAAECKNCIEKERIILAKDQTIEAQQATIRSQLKEIESLEFKIGKKDKAHCG
jgi:transcriptional regulator with XRE-family HTH domain